MSIFYLCHRAFHFQTSCFSLSIWALDIQDADYRRAHEATTRAKPWCAGRWINGIYERSNWVRLQFWAKASTDRHGSESSRQVLLEHCPQASSLLQSSMNCLCRLRSLRYSLHWRWQHWLGLRVQWQWFRELLQVRRAFALLEWHWKGSRRRHFHQFSMSA